MRPAEQVERAYRFLVEVGRAIYRAGGEAELTDEVCRLAVERAGYRLAWVGYREIDGSHAVRPVAERGFDDGYLARAEIRWDESPRGRGPTGTAIRTGVSQVTQNIATDPRLEPWRGDALARGYSASAAIPLRDRDVVFGVLNVYASEPHAFGPSELELLETVALDLSHAILAARGSHELSRLQAGIGQLDRLDAMVRSAAMHAHDMNNHLTVLRLCLEQLVYDNLTEATDAMADANRALDRAIELNRRIMRLSKPADESISVFPLDEAVRESKSELEHLVGPKIALDVVLDASRSQVRMDRTSLDGVLSNLVVNARDAMARRGHLKVETRSLHLAHPIPMRYLGVEPGEFVALRVTDDGPGIPPAIRERIFEPYFSTKGEHGSGLGLASVHATVRRAGGAIAVDSAPGEGTTFEIILPDVAANAAAE